MGKLGKLSLAIASAGFLVLAAASQAKSAILEYENSIGSPGFAPGQLAVPQGIAIDPKNNNVVVADGGNDRLSIFDQSGNFIKTIGSKGSGPGQFKEPAAVTYSPINGNLYVGDVFNNRVDVLDPQGNFLSSFGSFGGQRPDRFFYGPGGATFDKAGNFYIADFSNDNIQVYDQNNTLIKNIGTNGTGDGQFNGPAGVAISKNTGNIYVTDQYNNRIQVLDKDGKFIRAFGGPGTGVGQFAQPIGIEVDENENIYVADSINSRVQVFDQNGKFLESYGTPAGAPPGPTDPPFGNPLNLTPGKFNWTAGEHYQDGKLYVGDFFQGRIQVLKVNSPAKVPESTPVFGLGLLAAIAAASTLKKRSSKSVLDLTKKLEKTAV